MKKLIVLSLILMFALFSCGKKETSELKDEVKKDTKVTEKIDPEEFIKAVKDGKAAVVKDMLGKDATLAKYKAKELEETALISAAFYGKKDICELLIKAGADVNAKNYYGITPLHDAARMDHQDVIELLLENKADINAKSSSGESVLYYAAEFEHPDLVKFLISKGADKSIPDNEGKTPLQMAKDKKYQTIIDVLK
jgi:uncharacterized protein